MSHKINKITPCGNYCKIALEDKYGKKIATTIVDSALIDKVSKYYWGLKRSNSNEYATTNVWSKEKKHSKHLRLHIFLLGKKEGFEIDHINGNGLDNRIENLRFVTRKQNSMNNKKKGYSFLRTRGKWRARIMVDGKEIHLGLFKTEEEARECRIKGEQKYFGVYARKKKLLTKLNSYAVSKN